MNVMVQGKNPRFVDKASQILRKYEILFSDDPEILISVGGDGSTLYNYRRFRKPILPVRTSESLGYISDFGIESFEQACGNLAKGSYYVEKRLALDVYKNNRNIGLAINDVTIMQVPKEAMRYGVYANGEALFDFEKVMGDGVIIATPTGSTGYNRSAGGYILQTSDKIVVTLRYPVFLESQQEKSRILDKNSVIEFKFYRPDEAFMIIDNNFLRIKDSDRIVVKKSNETFDLVRIRGMEEDRRSKEKRRIQWFERQLF